jgi:hypothetical protein
MIHYRRSRIFVIALLCGCAFVAAGVWLSSGTMAPYASTLARPWIVKPCNYLLNTDNSHFEATFLMLDGAPREQWKFSIVARRILFPLLAYPLMKLWGFLVGGVVTSAVLQIAAFIGFVLYVRSRIGIAAAYAAVALLATYPGIYYWAGIPYSYAAIVPACLAGLIILIEIERQPSTPRVALLALALGIVLLAYDLLPFFGPPMIGMLLFRRRWLATAIAILLILTPSVINNFLLYHWAKMPLHNQNTQAYADVVQAYMQPIHFGYWRRSLAEVPRNFAYNYFACNFLFLPALFLVLLIVNRLTLRLRLTLAEKGVLLMTLLLFAFLNLAPPHEGWQFRGIAVARIYQPVFVVFLLFALRFVQSAWHERQRMRRPLIGLVGVTAAANAAIVLGPALHLRVADEAYFAFYRHATHPMFLENLDRFGRRPLGFCDTSITIENPPPRRKGPKLTPEERKQREINRVKKEKKKMTKAKRLRLRQQAATRAATQQAAPPPAAAP